MNRYRTLPGLGPPKASTTTTCQKCLKKGHYSYECKSTAQERPYSSRPSRSQQFMNPKLKPKLASDMGNSLMQSEGIADQELARVQAARGSATSTPLERRSRSPQQNTAREHARSASALSSGSVSTISTSRSRSPRDSHMSNSGRDGRRRERKSRSRSSSKTRKRKHRDSISRSPPRLESAHKTRRYRNDSPDDRGRPTDDRRGSRRSRSKETSLDRSEVTKQRRSLEDVYVPNKGRRNASLPQYAHRNAQPPRPRKERSLSPYSRRLALTQAMNMGR